MREWSLHVLDLVENSLRAGSRHIRVALTDRPERDRLEIDVDDDGSGLEEPEAATDPFFTTKPGKRVGLGLPLIRFQAEQAGGGLELGRSELGGLSARVWLQRSHVDRNPLGDLGSTICGVVATNDDALVLDLILAKGERRATLSTTDLRRDGVSAMAVALQMQAWIRQTLSDLSIEEEEEILSNATRTASASTTACAEKATDRELEARLDQVLAEYRHKPGALIPVLQITQGIYGYLPDGALKRIARELGKSYSEVAGVVGFYSFFSRVPRGKHLVRVCLGTACYVRGGKLVLEALKEELGIDVGGTTEDGLFSLEVGRCFGACGLAPTIMVGDDVVQRVKPARVRAILDVYRNGASVPVRKTAAVPKRSAARGKTARRGPPRKATTGASRRGGKK